MDMFAFDTTELGITARILTDGSLTGHDFIWVDALRDDIARDPVAWQQQIFHSTGVRIDEFHMTDILNAQHPSSFDLTNEYEILIFRKLMSSNTPGTSLNPANLTTLPVVFILTDRALVTVRDSSSQTFSSFRQRLTQQCDEPNSRSMRLPTSTLDLTLRILNALVDKYLELRLPLTQRIDDWQNLLLRGNHRFKEWQRLLNERLALHNLENLCEEQVDSLQELRDSYLDRQSGPQHTNVEPQTRRDLILVRINDLTEHVSRVQSHVSRLENALKSAVELHFSATSNQTNETMRFLAIITAIFSPLTLLTGIYGMNFDIMPGLHNPHGFWFMLGGMLLTTFGLLYYFHRRQLVGRGERSVIDLLTRELISKEPPEA
ncbi:magnesium transporter [Formosimonas limnophila]|uniref:Magnesium transporter n=1 Tax=Formosimonas limnophila TaxID=1384487 RepID=A0A8J3CNR7_9BURK|nr:magnesium transporter CorA family protein [Formosimonas limnophila]GHA77319.1 magnesium transporter [Formosimonas limnophila]